MSLRLRLSSGGHTDRGSESSEQSLQPSALLQQRDRSTAVDADTSVLSGSARIVVCIESHNLLAKLSKAADVFAGEPWSIRACGPEQEVMRGGTFDFSFLFSRVGIPTMFMLAMLNRVN